MGCPVRVGHAQGVTTYLATERLTLRPFTADDADLLIELDSDPAVMRYLSGGEPTAPELVRERDLPSLLAGYERWDGEVRAVRGAREGQRRVRRLVLPASRAGWSAGRGRARVPAAPGRVGQGVRHRGLAGAARQGVLGARRARGLGRDDVPEPRLAEGDGEGRHDRRGDARHSRGHADGRGLRAGRLPVRDHQGAVGRSGRPGRSADDELDAVGGVPQVGDRAQGPVGEPDRDRVGRPERSGRAHRLQVQDQRGRGDGGQARRAGLPRPAPAPTAGAASTASCSRTRSRKASTSCWS